MVVKYAEKPIRCTSCGATFTTVVESSGHPCFQGAEVEYAMRGTSMNGKAEYAATFTIDPNTVTEHMLEKEFRSAVISLVREEYGATPEGVGYLLNLFSIEIAAIEKGE